MSENRLEIAWHCVEHIAENKQNSIAQDTMKKVRKVSMEPQDVYKLLIETLLKLEPEYNDVKETLDKLRKLSKK
jgi:hypothetical protein